MTWTVATIRGADAATVHKRASEIRTDVVEVRLDALDPLDASTVEAAIGPLEVPVLATLRSVAEGGAHDGDAASRADLLRAALDAGATLIDVEAAWSNATEIVHTARGAGAIAVVSTHLDHAPDRDEAARLFRRAADVGADVAKLAAATASVDDVHALAEAALEAIDAGIPVAVMGLDDPILRAAASSLDLALVYCRPDDQPGAAGGQLPARLQRRLCRPTGPAAIGGATRLVALLGDPVHHSLSPAMMNAAFARTGLDAAYVALPTPEGSLRTHLDSLMASGAIGGNVTTPHKDDLARLAHTTDEADRSGAANTFRFVDGRIEATNTDGAGAMHALDRHGVRPGTLLVVGAGATGRAVAEAAARDGFDVLVANRSVERAERLAEAVEGSATGLSSTELGAACVEADVLFNATPLGDLPVDTEALPQVVFQASYARASDLVDRARTAGRQVLDGLDLLHGQGVLAFTYWTGREPPEGAMLHALRRARIAQRLTGGAA